MVQITPQMNSAYRHLVCGVRLAIAGRNPLRAAPRARAQEESMLDDFKSHILLSLVVLSVSIYTVKLSSESDPTDLIISTKESVIVPPEQLPPSSMRKHRKLVSLGGLSLPTLSSNASTGPKAASSPWVQVVASTKTDYYMNSVRKPLPRFGHSMVIMGNQYVSISVCLLLTRLLLGPLFQTHL
jgi:hypothetical protein